MLISTKIQVSERIKGLKSRYNLFKPKEDLLKIPILPLIVRKFTFLVGGHDSIRGCVRSSVGWLVCWSVGPLPLFGGQKGRRQTIYAMYPALFNQIQTNFWIGTISLVRGNIFSK